MVTQQEATTRTPPPSSTNIGPVEIVEKGRDA